MFVRRVLSAVLACALVVGLMVVSGGAAIAGSVADRFDYPVGSGDCGEHSLSEYRVEPGADFLDPAYLADLGSEHPGEDWNRGGGDADYGDPVCAIANGSVVAAQDYGGGWGRIVLIKHDLPDGTSVWSQYAHLSRIDASSGDVVRGQKIGEIGNANGVYPNAAHLHFEIRVKDLPASNWPGTDRSAVLTNYVDPSDFATDSYPEVGFIESHRDLRVESSTVDLALIIDSSGSMGSNDPDDKRKTGASLLIEAAIDGDRMTVVDFDSDAVVLGPLAELPGATDDLLAAVALINSSGYTDIGDGLEAAFDQLVGSDSENPKAAILLTDGKQTSGPYLDEHLYWAARGWPVYTIGLSDNADADLLREIADATGGSFEYLDNADALTGTYLRIRSQLVGSDAALDTTVSVDPGSTTTVQAAVESGLLQMSWLSYWSGSTVDMTITSPSGDTYTCASGTRVECTQGAIYELITIELPEPGTWLIDLYGTDVPAGGEDVSVLVTGIPALLPPGGSFVDDDGDTHEASIEAIAAANITRGCNPPDNTMFCPDKAVTRGQMAAFLVRALGLTDDGGGSTFIDDDGSVFETDIAKLAAAGITRGCNPPDNTMFCPDEAVTRGQMAAFLVRALGYTSATPDLFVDDDGSVFEADIDKLGTAGVTRGCNPPINDRYCPKNPVKRSQMATFLIRGLHLTPIEPPSS